MKRFFSQLNYYLAKVYMPIWNFLVWLYEYIKYALFPRYKLTVSYNAIFGDSDDKDYIVKKFHKKQDKYLSFTTDDDELVEIRGAEGLNYRIEQL
tara:strand:- start:11681 stop:11965 length:285 start_codon:yes stop_codon:yes gene_type:complete